MLLRVSTQCVGCQSLMGEGEKDIGSAEEGGKCWRRGVSAPRTNPPPMLRYLQCLLLPIV